jgi:beta-mannosidase
MSVWAFNSGIEDRVAKLVVDAFDIQSGKLYSTQTTKTVRMNATQSTEIVDFEIDEKEAWNLVLSARLIDEDANVLSRHANWPEPLKFVKFASNLESAVDVRLDESKGEVKISVERPVK